MARFISLLPYPSSPATDTLTALVYAAAFKKYPGREWPTRARKDVVAHANATLVTGEPVVASRAGRGSGWRRVRGC